MYYIAFLLLIFALSIKLNSRFNIVGRVYFPFLFVLMFVFVGFRYGGTGTADYFNYLSFYDLTADFNDVVKPRVPVEIGFRFFSFIGNYFNLPSQFIILIMAFFSLLPIFYISYKYSLSIYFSLIVAFPFILAFSMQSSRSSVAMGFGLLFIISLVNKQSVISFVFFLLACSFHISSSALVLCLVLLINLRLRYFIFLLLVSISLVLFSDIFLVLSSVFSALGLSLLSAKVIGYAAGSEWGYSMPLYDPRVLLQILIALAGVLAYKRYKNEFSYFYISLLKAQIMGLAIMILFSSSTIISWRISSLFFISEIILVPYICYLIDRSVTYNGIKIRFGSIMFKFSFLLYGLMMAVLSQPYDNVIFQA